MKKLGLAAQEIFFQWFFVVLSVLNKLEVHFPMDEFWEFVVVSLTRLNY